MADATSKWRAPLFVVAIICHSWQGIKQLRMSMVLRQLGDPYQPQLSCHSWWFTTKYGRLIAMNCLWTALNQDILFLVIIIDLQPTHWLTANHWLTDHCYHNNHQDLLNPFAKISAMSSTARQNSWSHHQHQLKILRRQAAVCDFRSWLYM